MTIQETLAAVTTIGSLGIAAWALFISWRIFGATMKQAEVAERTRKSSIRPYVVAFTRQYPHEDPVYLIIANVGFGTAKDIRARVVKGADFEPIGNPIRDWKPLREPISILRVNERLWTMLFSVSLPDSEKFRDCEVAIELTYSDIEGTMFGPEQFSLDLLPNDGVQAGRLKRTIGGEVVEDRALRPENI